MNPYGLFFGSSVLLILLGISHLIVWRFNGNFSKLKQRFFKKMPVLAMPIEGSEDAQPGRVYARVKQEFAEGNEGGCELPLIFMISKNLDKEFPDLREMLAKCYLVKNQIAKAELVLAEALAEETFSAAIHGLMAEVHKREKRYQEALDVLKKGIKEIESHDELLEPMYLMAKKLRNDKDVKTALKRLVKLDEENEDLKKELKKLS